MAFTEYTDLKVNKFKFERIKQLYPKKDELEIMDQVFDDILFMADLFIQVKKISLQSENKRLVSDYNVY